MKKILLLFTFVLTATCFQLNAATVTWDGGAGTTDWFDVLNWDTDALPTSADDVDLDGNTVVLTASTTVQRVYAGGSSDLTINVGITLTITGFAGDDGLEIQGSASVTNNGTIAISNITGAAGDGLYVKGEFSNSATGTLTVDGTGEYNIYVQGGTFTNNGTITLTNFGNSNSDRDGIAVDDNGGTGGTFNNNAGTITITMTGADDGIYVNDSSTFNNAALITIGGTGGDNGIRVDDASVFNNNSGGTCTINSTPDDQLFLDNDGAFNNTGTVNLNNAVDVGLYVTDQGVFTNNSGGNVNISSASNFSIQVDANSSTANISNSGTFTTTGGKDGLRLQESGIFTNNSGGLLDINSPNEDGINIQSSGGTINNTGTIDISSTPKEGMDMIGGTFNNNNGGIFKVVDGAEDALEINTGCTVINDGDMQLTFTTDGSGRDDIEFNGGTFTNNSNATFNPGNAGTYGELEFRGNIDLGTSTTTFDISGSTHTTEFDRIDFPSSGSSLTITNATAHLNWGSYVPTIGDTFKIVDGSATVTGTFSSVTTSNSDIVTTINYSANEVQVEVTDINSTWTGNTDNDWDTVGNWSTIVPTATTDVTIPSGLTNYPTASSAVTTNGITMASGTSFIANSTVTGALTYTRTLGTTNWYTISSPVVGQDEDDFATAAGLATSGGNQGLASYNTLDNTWSYYDGTASANTLINGQGYSVKLASAGDISFTGTLLTSDLTPITLTTTGDGFNLSGNPYPSYINSATMLTTSTASLDSETLWVWNQGTSSYDPKVTADTYQIAPGQGFFVKSDGASGTLEINEAFQSHQGTDTFQKGDYKSEIHLTLSDGTNQKLAKVYYIDGTTIGFDNGFDGPMFSGVSNSFAVYTQSINSTTGRDLGIQSLPKDYENLIIPVGVNALSGKEITLSATSLNLPDGVKVFLEDRMDNVFTNLDEENYTITLSGALNGTGRFFLHTSSKSALSVDDITLNNISIYKANASTLRIVGLQQGKTDVKLYTILGKEVLHSSFEANGAKDITLPTLAKGIYIVQLANENSSVSKKIILE